VAVAVGVGAGEADGSAVESNGEANATKPVADDLALGEGAGPLRSCGAAQARAATIATASRPKAARGMCGVVLTKRGLEACADYTVRRREKAKRQAR
jgi:hypothetical protein